MDRIRTEQAADPTRKAAHDMFGGDGSTIVGDISMLCLGAFMMLFLLASFEPAEMAETALPAMNLSGASLRQSGSSDSSAVTVSLKHAAGGIGYFMENEALDEADLEKRLHSFGGLVTIHLRSEATLPVAEQNKILAMCERAGIARVSIVVRREEGSR